MPDVHGEEEHASYVGIPTFIHAPLALTAAKLKEMEADIAIIGAPAEMVIYRPGARFGASPLFITLGFQKVVERHAAACPPCLKPALQGFSTLAGLPACKQALHA